METKLEELAQNKYFGDIWTNGPAAVKMFNQITQNHHKIKEFGGVHNNLVVLEESKELES